MTTTISIKEVLDYMHSGKPFVNMKVVTYDKRRKDRSGQILHIPEGVLVWGEGDPKPAPAQGERPMTALETALSGFERVPLEEDKRNPNHARWYTRNIRQFVGGQPTESIIKIHPALIIEFNGLTTTA